MIEEVVGNIIAAEDKAKETVAKAKEEAGVLSAKAQSDSEVRRAAYLKEHRQTLAAQEKAAQEKAQAAYGEILAEGQKSAQKISDVCDGNMKKAVAAIVSAVVS